MQRFFYYFVISIATITVFTIYYFSYFEIIMQEASAQISTKKPLGDTGAGVSTKKPLGDTGEQFEKATGIDYPFSIEEIKKDPKKLFLLDPNYIIVMKTFGLDPDPAKAQQQLQQKRDQVMQRVKNIESGCREGISQDVKTGVIKCAVTVHKETNIIPQTPDIIKKNVPDVDVVEICSKAGFDKFGGSCTALDDLREDLLQWWDSHYSQFKCGMEAIKFTDSVNTLKKIAKNPNSNMETIQCVIPYTDAIKFQDNILGQLSTYLK